MAVQFIFVLLLWQTFIALGQSQYPSCSTACLPAACSSSDNVCICDNINTSSLLSCLAASCSCDDQITAASDLNANCGSNGVQLGLSVTCSAAASSPTSSSTSSSSSTTSSSAAATSSSSSSSSYSPATASSSSATSTSTYTPPPAYTPSSTPSTSTSYSYPSSSPSTAVLVSSDSGSVLTSTAVVVFASGTVTQLITSTNYYTISSSGSATGSNSASGTAGADGGTHGSLIKQGLSTGAKAGIGVGVAAVVLAAVALSIWLFWCCRRKRRRSSISASDRYPPTPDPATFGSMIYGEKEAPELPSSEPSRKPAFSWGSSSVADSLPRQPISEGGEYLQPVSEEGVSPPPMTDMTAYQQPILGPDGYWANAQELGAEPPTRHPSHNIQSNRPIVPKGKWPPTWTGINR